MHSNRSLRSLLRTLGLRMAIVVIASLAVRSSAHSAERTPSPRARLLSVDISGVGRESTILVSVSAEVTYAIQVRPDGERELVIQNTRVPDELVRRLNAMRVEGPVGVVSTYAEADGTARIRVSVKTTADEVKDTLNIYKSAASVTLEWKLSGTEMTQSAIERRRWNRTRGEPDEEPPPPPPRPPAAKREYTGKRISFTAKELELQEFLDAIAEIAKCNIVADPDIHGRVTVRVRETPWDEVLDTALQPLGLGTEKIGSTIRVAKVSKLESQANLRTRMEASSAPRLKARTIQVYYANAKTLAARVKAILSPNGTVTVDEQTGALIVTDKAELLPRAEALVRALDTTTPQVHIEARFVEAPKSFFDSLALQAPKQPESSESVSGARAPADARFAFGIAKSARMNDHLAAAELNGTIRILNAPTVTTLVNQPVTIPRSGTEPTARTSTCANGCDLSVTPQVAANRAVLLSLREVGTLPPNGAAAGNGVLVRDGETLVLREQGTRSSNQKTGEETLILVTPIVINR